MTQPLAEVDTSLDQNTGMETGRSGIDAPTGESLVSGWTMPSVSAEDFATAFDGKQSNFSGLAAQASGNRAAVVEYAKQFLGTPYVWGGAGPGGFDCSGLMQYAWKKFGVNLPRVSQDQANAGKRVALDKLRPGDLVLFPGSTNGGRQGPGHVAMWLGNGQILEAPRAGKPVRIRDLGNENVFGVALSY